MLRAITVRPKAVTMEKGEILHLVTIDEMLVALCKEKYIHQFFDLKDELAALEDDVLTADSKAQ